MTEFAKDIYTEPNPIDDLLIKVAEPTPNPLAR